MLQFYFFVLIFLIYIDCGRIQLRFVYNIIGNIYNQIFVLVQKKRKTILKISAK